jgi:hypothetical protein
MSAFEIPERLRLDVRPAASDERWALRSEYVEQVWSKALGPTALLVARRLGGVIEESPSGAEISIPELAHDLGVGESKVESSLQRLARNALVSYSREYGVIGASGFARSVGEHNRSALSRRAVEIHDRMVAEVGAGSGAGESWVQRRAERVNRLGESLASGRSARSVPVGGYGR